MEDYRIIELKAMTKEELISERSKLKETIFAKQRLYMCEPDMVEIMEVVRLQIEVDFIAVLLNQTAV